MMAVNATVSDVKTLSGVALKNVFQNVDISEMGKVLTNLIFVFNINMNVLKSVTRLGDLKPNW